MMYGYGAGWGLGGALFGGIFMIIFWVLVIWLIVSLVRSGGHLYGPGGCGRDRYNNDGHGDWRKPEDSAMMVLRERYAKGEISKEEFEERMRVLKNS